MENKHQQRLMMMQERLASLLVFAERVNIITEQCIEAEDSGDKEAERQAVEEIELLDEDLDRLLTDVTQAEIEEIAHAHSEESLLANVDWLRSCSRRLDELADKYTEAIRERHDVKRAVELRQQVKKLGHTLVRGRKLKEKE